MSVEYLENNGIKGKIAKQIFEPNEAYTITATVIGNYKYVKYQREPYYTSQNINKLIPKFDMTTGAIYYLITHIYRFVSLFDGQQGGYKLDELKKHKILLPIKDDRLALSYMENYIKVLENERIETLEAYLLVSGFKDYQLTKRGKRCSERHLIINNGKSFVWVAYLTELKPRNYLYKASVLPKRATKEGVQLTSIDF